MHFTPALSLYGVLHAAAAVSAITTSVCKADNCLRAVRASAFPTRMGTADCSSYFSVTINEPSSTVTPTNIPTYASACSGSVRYSSACSCIGVTHVTTLIYPSCAAGTLSCNGGPCQDVLSDPNNCGKCGNVCPSGVCLNGECSAPVCDGSTCGSLNSCGADCFCFETSIGTGFCGPNIPCAPLADCTQTSDCAAGEVCATSTCCERNVCLGACSSQARRDVFGRNATEPYTGGQAPA